MKDYYEFLKQEMLEFRGDYEKFVDYVPDFFKLLCNLLNEEGVSPHERLLINAALAYFVTPLDVIPEDIYGPAGYVDDVFVCTFVLKKLAENHGENIIKRNWESDEDAIEAINTSYEKSDKIVDEKGIKEKIMRYSGLSEVI